MKDQKLRTLHSSVHCQPGSGGSATSSFLRVGGGLHTLWAATVPLGVASPKARLRSRHCNRQTPSLPLFLLTAMQSIWNHRLTWYSKASSTTTVLPSWVPAAVPTSGCAASPVPPAGRSAPCAWSRAPNNVDASCLSRCTAASPARSCTLGPFGSSASSSASSSPACHAPSGSGLPLQSAGLLMCGDS